MPDVYLTVAGSTLQRDRGGLVVSVKDDVYPLPVLALIERVFLVGAVSITPPALNLLLGTGHPLVFLTRTGRLKGILARPGTSDSRSRLAQSLLLSRPDIQIAFASEHVTWKIEAMQALMSERQRRNGSAALQRQVQQLDILKQRAYGALSLDVLRGTEGAASAAYYRMLARLFSGPITFPGRRSRRPPRDPVNAVLSLLYMLLTTELTDIITAHGLDPALGTLHAFRHGRPSLACDLVEPFRVLAADRFALRLFNRQELRPEHLAAGGAGGVRLQPDALRAVLAKWEAFLQEPVPAYTAAALQACSSGDDPAAGTLPGMRGLLHRHVRQYRETLLDRVDVDSLLAGAPCLTTPT